MSLKSSTSAFNKGGTWDRFFERGISLVHIIGVEHLVSFIPAEIEPFLEIGITHVIEVNNPAESDLVVGLLVFIQFNELAFLLGRRIPEPSCVDEDILGQSLY